MKFIADYIKAIISIIVILASFCYFFVTYFVGKSQSDPQIIIAIVGAMTMVLQYYFGSSQGASKQADTIGKALEASGSGSQNVEEINANNLNVAKKL